MAYLSHDEMARWRREVRRHEESHPAKTFEIGTIVLGPFYDDGHQGAGVVVERGRELWTRVPDEYVPVRIIAGNRANGGYRPDSLIATTDQVR